MAEKDFREGQNDDQGVNASPGPLRTDVSNSTAQNTVARPQASVEDQNINGGPSVGIEDSKFLLESSLNQHSISMPQDSKFSAGAGQETSQSAMKNASGRVDNVDTPHQEMDGELGHITAHQQKVMH